MDNELLSLYEESLIDVAGCEHWAFDKLMEFRMMYKCENGQYRRTDIWPNNQLSEDDVRTTIANCNEYVDAVDAVSDYGSWKEVLANV